MDQDKTELALVRCDNSEAVNYELIERGLMCEAWVMKSRWLMMVGWEWLVGWWELFILNLNCSQCTASQLVPCKQNSTYQIAISSLLENLLFESNRRKFGKRVNEKIRQE